MNKDLNPASWRFMLKLVIAGILLYAVWLLGQLLLLVFAALLGAVILRALSNPIAAHARVGDRVSLAISLVLISAFVTGLAIVFGATVIQGAGDVWKQFPSFIGQIEQWLRLSDLWGWLENQELTGLGGPSLLKDLTGMSAWALAIPVNILLVISGAVFFAANPGIYRRGFVRLFPQETQAEVEDSLFALGRALRLWLIGQLVSMICVAVLTTIGLMILGVPSALALGFLAGMLEFVPYVGPILSAIPAVAVALSQSPMMAVWVMVLYFVVQQAEAAVIVPLLQRRAVNLPPALTVFSLIAFGILFGPMGILLGAPLTVVAFVLVKIYWVRDTLGQDTSLPGE